MFIVFRFFNRIFYLDITALIRVTSSVSTAITGRILTLFGKNKGKAERPNKRRCPKEECGFKCNRCGIFKYYTERIGQDENDRKQDICKACWRLKEGVRVTRADGDESS